MTGEIIVVHVLSPLLLLSSTENWQKAQSKESAHVVIVLHRSPAWLSHTLPSSNKSLQPLRAVPQSLEHICEKSISFVNVHVVTLKQCQSAFTQVWFSRIEPQRRTKNKANEKNRAH